MLISKSSLAAAGLSLLLPCYVNGQESSATSKGLSPTESDIGTQQREGSPATIKEQSATSPKTDSDRRAQQSDQTLISVQSLTGSKVLDTDNKQLGSVKNILIDPEDGKLVRADIAFGGGNFLGGEQRISVPWNQLTVKRQDQSFVVVLDKEIVAQVSPKKEESTRDKRDQQQGTMKNGKSEQQQSRSVKSK